MSTYETDFLKDNPEAKPFINDISMERGYAAFRNTSHFPERGAMIQRCSYVATLLTDKESVEKIVRRAKRMGATIADDYQDLIDAWFKEHRTGLIDKYNAWLSSHANVASSFICGPANFPVARNLKRSQWADNHYENIGKYRHTSKKRILRDIMPWGDGTSIKTNDPDAVSKIDQKIENLERQRDKMKLTNKTVRKFYKREDVPAVGDGKYEDCIKALNELDFSDSEAAALLKVDWRGCVPFPSYSLTNLGAEIRRLKQRTQEVEAVKAVTIEDDFPGGETARISDDGKIVIEFGYKPDEETRKTLKSRAFKWSRQRVAWVRKATANAIWAYQNEIKPMLATMEQ